MSLSSRALVLCWFVAGMVSGGQRAAAAPLPAAAATASGAPGTAAVQVSLPLAEYEKLVSKPSVTVVDALRLSGSFNGHDLTLALSGRSAGLWPKIEVLSAPISVSIYGCEGEAILAKSASGVFELVPLSARFSVRCRITTSASDRLQLDITPAVLWVESQVTDGELVSGATTGEPAGSRRSISVVRVTGGSGELLKPSATARYRITLQPEATRFTYQIDVTNPNRAHQPFVVTLRSGEHVQKVDAAVGFEPVVEGATAVLGSSQPPAPPGHGGSSDGERERGALEAYLFKLPPGEQTLTISGTLPRAAFTPPVPASVHYLLLESHPLLRPNITTSAQRISAQETGLPISFRGARGFLLADAEKVSWQVARLEALRTTSFAVSSVQHTFFLSGDGQALGESVLRLDNQGAPALSLPMRAEPSYASLERESVLLTRDDSGHLWLPLGQGPQQVLVQHRQALRRFGGLASGVLWLPELTVPASSASVELRYGREWVPLYEEFAPELRLSAIDLGSLIGLLLLFIWSERLLALLGVRRGYRFGAGGLLSFAALTSPWWLTLLCAGDLSLTILLSFLWLLRRKWNPWTLVGALIVGGMVCLIGISVLITSRSAPMSKVSSVAERYPYASREEAPASDKAKPGDDRGAGYQGLPAKVLMPIGNEQSYYQREMLASAPGAPRVVYVLLLSRPALGLLGSLLFGVGLLLLLGQRRQLRRGFFDLWQRLRHPAGPAS